MAFIDMRIKLTRLAVLRATEKSPTSEELVQTPSRRLDDHFKVMLSTATQKSGILLTSILLVGNLPFMPFISGEARFQKNIPIIKVIKQAKT